MPGQKVVTVRLPDRMIERLDALAPIIADELEGAATGRADRSVAIRVALREGLTWLEAKHRAALERARGGGPK